jgi:hypothetical protein
MGAENLYWINQKHNSFTPIENPGIFTEHVHRSGVRVDTLLGEKSHLEKKMYQGSLFLLKKIRPTSNFKLSFQSSDLTVCADRVTLDSKNLKLSYT